MSLQESTLGVVHLVGAGPGAAGLLTLQAAELLASAGSVVYDRLCGYHFLSHVKPGTRLHNVGKRDNHHLVPQEEICALLVAEAQAGYRVVRLKGGDPYVFGRGGEEAEYLLAHQVPFTVVPGISSSIAVPASAGIPVTHRDHCTSFHVITGHLRAERSEGAYDFAALAALKGTLVFLMGVKNLQRIVAGLLEHGMSPQTPAAVVSKGCSAHQRQVHAPLCGLVEAVEKSAIEAPAITIVGDVTAMGPLLRMGNKDERPLAGKKVLVTRTRHQAGKLSGLLRAAGAEALELPLVETTDCDDDRTWIKMLAALPHSQWLVFTSENGVRAFFSGLRARSYDIRVLSGMQIAVVGTATAAALLEHGLVADLVPAPHSATALASALAGRIQAGDSVLLARAAVADSELPRILQEKGADVQDFALYVTRPYALAQELLPEILTDAEIDWVPFASSSAVEAFVQALPSGFVIPSSVRIACIGPSTKTTALRLGLPVHAEATVATLPGLVDALF